MERIKYSNNGLNVASLFSGIGGLDLGFEFAGFNVVWANDFDRYAVQTYKSNVNENIVYGDIREVKTSIPKHDVLIGGFPCQPFSTLGKLKGFEDESRGTLFFEILDIIKSYDTKIVVLENVKNLVNHDSGNTFKRIITELSDAGYICFHSILNSCDFGIPQRRNRVFIVAFNKKYFSEKIEFCFPQKEELKVTTQDLLDKEVDAKYFLSQKLEKTIMGVGTKGYIVKPTIDLPISKTLCATMHKMHRASQDNYVTDRGNWEKANDPNRVPIRRLTPNECRKLQGFPSDWIQVVSDCQAFKQFGNAVTVDVAFKVAVQVLDTVNKYAIWERGI